MNLIKTNDNENYFLIVEDSELKKGVPYYTEYYICENEKELKSILSNEKEVDGWNKLSDSYYKDGDVLFEEAVDNLENDLVLIKDENGVEKLEDCFWDWEDFYVYWDGNNNRTVSCDVEIYDFEYETVDFEIDTENLSNSVDYNVLKSGDQYYVEELSNFEGEGNSVFEVDVVDGEIWFSPDSSVGINFVLKESKKSFKKFINEHKKNK